LPLVQQCTSDNGQHQTTEIWSTSNHSCDCYRAGRRRCLLKDTFKRPNEQQKSHHKKVSTVFVGGAVAEARVHVVRDGK